MVQGADLITQLCVKLTRLMSFLTSKKVWKFLVKNSAEKILSKRTRVGKCPPSCTCHGLNDIKPILFAHTWGSKLGPYLNLDLQIVKVLTIKSGCDTIESRIVIDKRPIGLICCSRNFSLSDVKYLLKRSNVLPLFDYVSLNDKFLEQQLGHRKDF